jgi:chromosomal replication initiation ATPase DnaA
VAQSHGILPEAIVDKSRKAPIVRARQELFYRAQNEQHMSASQIGRYMKCDHTTIMHGVKQHTKLLNKKLSVGTV